MNYLFKQVKVTFGNSKKNEGTKSGIFVVSYDSHVYFLFRFVFSLSK